MPGPPPPAPPPPGPPPPSFSMPKLGGGGGGSDDRGALLKSIRQGTKLKKTVTVDKSAPIIPGQVSSVGNSNTPSGGRNGVSSPSSAPNGMALGGLFAGGMPKLKATGRLGSSTVNSSSNLSLNNNNNESDKSPSPKVTPSKKFNSVQDQLKRQLHNPSETRTRGPPPPAPMRQLTVEEQRPVKAFTVHGENSNGLRLSHSSLHANVSSLHANNSTLHRKSKSNANLSSIDCTDNVNISGFQPGKPVINHGKPNLAPKPPTLNGKPALPNKLPIKPNKTISRAHSMRMPRSPSPQSPTPPNDACIKFGTVRNMSSVLGQSLNNLNSQNSSRSRPPLTGRPSVPPPSVPAPATPSLKLSIVKPPNHAPPPPPGGLPLPPNHAPPPPPHKTQTMPIRAPPAIPTNNVTNPPPPPPRHSSMRDVNQTSRRVVDFEEKFRGMFNTPDKFPQPPPYRSVIKMYSNRQVTSKQQAPLPPQLSLQQPQKSWNSTSTC